MSINDDIVELLKSKLDEAKRDVVRLERALAALHDQEEHEMPEADKTGSSTKGVDPPIWDICWFLKQKDKPIPQREIINVVGAERQRKYPSLTNHFQGVWRALEYHVRKGRLIACVDPATGRSTLLKPLPARPKGTKLHNDPALYYQDNWFVLLEKVVERQIPSINAAMPPS